MPQRTITIPVTRGAPSYIQSLLGKGLNQALMPYTASLGIVAQPVTIPDDMDVSYPSTIKVTLTTPNNTNQSGAVVRFLLELAIRFPDATWNAPSGFVSLWTPPAPWATTYAPEIDVVLDYPFPAGYFTAQSLVGFAYTRTGSHASDTYNSDFNVITQFRFTYQLRCQHASCL